MERQHGGVAGHRVAALGVQLVHLALFGATLSEAGTDTLALAASGVASAVLYAAFLLAEYRWNGYRPTPILFYLAAGVFRLGACVLFVVAAVSEDRWDLLRVGVYDVSAFLMHGHWVALVGDWCFLAGYVIVTSLRSRRFRTPGDVPPTLWGRVWSAGLLAAVLAFAIRLAGRYVAFGGLDSLVSHVQSYGVAAGVYLMLLASGRGRPDWLSPRAAVASALLALDLVDGFFSYMKAPVLVALLPLVLLSSDLLPAGGGRARVRIVRPAVASLLVVYFFLFVVSGYSRARRPDFWRSSPVAAADPYTVPVGPHLAAAVRSALPGTARFRETHRFPEGAWRLVERMTLTEYAAWAYQRVDSAGYREGSFPREVLAAVIPRIFWPDKPVVSYGHDFAVTIGRARSVDTADTAFALSMQGAYYWWAGYAGLVLGCMLTGAGFAAAWLTFRNQLALNPVSAVVVLLLCHEGFRWFESAFLGAFPMYLYIFIVFAPLQRAVQRLIGYRVRRLTAGGSGAGPGAAAARAGP